MVVVLFGGSGGEEGRGVLICLCEVFLEDVGGGEEGGGGDGGCGCGGVDDVLVCVWGFFDGEGGAVGVVWVGLGVVVALYFASEVGLDGDSAVVVCVVGGCDELSASSASVGVGGDGVFGGVVVCGGMVSGIGGAADLSEGVFGLFASSL